MKNGRGKQPVRIQYAALPYRLGENGEPLIMLVTSRETRRWVAPKGWPIKDAEPYAAAEREAFEEAGLIGEIGKKPLGSYRYEKRLQNQATVTCEVEVFPFKVHKQMERWPEKQERETRWFRADEAAALVQEEGLSAIIRQLDEKVSFSATARARS